MRQLVSRAWLGLVVAGALLSPASASASSLVYLKAGDVYLGAPDGSVERQLTTGGGFESPSQSDGGTVFAVTRVDGEYNTGYIHALSRAGESLRPAVRCGPANSHTYAGPLAAEVSRDGALVAFHFFRQPNENPTAAYCPTDRDALTSEYGEIGGAFNPSWYGGDRVVLFSTSGLPNVFTDPPGHAPEHGSEGWFTDGDVRLSAGVIDRGMTKLAAVVRGGSSIRLYEMTGPPPAAPAARCAFTAPNDGQYEHPTWSPDGSQLAWDEPDGIHIATVPGLGDCTQLKQTLVIPGAKDPHWGPAVAPTAPEPEPQPIPRRCIVPKVKGKTLRQARRAIRNTWCRLGTVTRRKSVPRKVGRVLSQRPRARTRKPPGTKVHLLIGRR